MVHTPIDSAAVRALADLLNDTGLHEIEYDSGALRIRLCKNAPVQAVSGAAFPLPQMVGPTSAPAASASGGAGSSGAAAAPANPDDHPGAVKAPMVGVVYHSSEPGAPPFVKAGDRVSEGQTLVLIEAMKTFNPVRAPRSGVVAAVLVEDATPVEYGEPLVIIE